MYYLNLLQSLLLLYFKVYLKTYFYILESGPIGMHIVCTWKLHMICTPKSIFCISIPSVFIWRTIYRHFHETALSRVSTTFYTGLSNILFESMCCFNVTARCSATDSNSRVHAALCKQFSIWGKMSNDDWKHIICILPRAILIISVPSSQPIIQKFLLTH